MEEEVSNAIRIAWDPTSDQRLKTQAFEYLNQLRSDPSAWQLCLSLFVKEPPQDDIVRHVALETVSHAVKAGYLDVQALAAARDNLWQYIVRIYGPQGNKLRADTPAMQNKLAQLMTFLFSALYAVGWESFIDDFLGLTNQSDNKSIRDYVPGIIFYIRILNSIHDEIADVMVLRSPDEKAKTTELKDLIRSRDMHRIIASWQEILSQWRDRDNGICEMCLRTIGRWVSWVDISLLVDQDFLRLLFEQVSRAQQETLNESEEKVRDAAIDAFTEIVGKGMQPDDKINLVAFLNLDQLITQLLASPPLGERRHTSRYDTDLAETVAKLVNITGLDIIKCLEAPNLSGEPRQRAEELLQAFMQHILRFFSDEYDEVCSTVIPALAELLNFFRRCIKLQGSLPEQYSQSLTPILGAIITKSKYDETSSWGEQDDETDEAEFQELRKRLHTLQQNLYSINELLYIDAISEVVAKVFRVLQEQGDRLDWRELELGLYEIYQLGDLAVKSGGLYSKNKPVSPAADRLIAMMKTLTSSDISLFKHPATQILYMEICVRYNSFFENNVSAIPPTLEAFLHLVHSSVPKVRLRSWYLLFRFLRSARVHVGDVVESVISALQPLLVIQAELSKESEDDTASDDFANESSADAKFTSQLNLFEAIGCISGTAAVPVEKQVLYARSIMTPIFADMESQLPLARSGEERAILQIHHDIMALGTLAKGYSEWTPGNVGGNPPAAAVSTEFAKVGDATLTALESLNDSPHIRTAARFAFSRVFGVLGANLLPQLPRWINGLVTQGSTKDEMALFLRLLDQVIHGFKSEISGILDSLLTPFMQHVFAGIAEAPNGTDDEIQNAELKREYLNFILTILNNGLGSILVSPTNQAFFESVVSMLQAFAKDPSDLPTAKLTYTTLTKMALTWGSSASTKDGAQIPKEGLPGFNEFMITRFSPLCWSLPASGSFNPKDAQSKQALNEAASLQKAMFSICGEAYLAWLQGTELPSMGMSGEIITEYLGALTTLDNKGFKNFFSNLVQRSLS